MRRSSRARITQPATTTVNQTSSSSSPSLSIRADRAIRAVPRTNSFTKSGVTSSEDDMGSQDRSEPEARQTRQKKRELDVKEDADPGVGEHAEDVDEEEEDVTRCICRRQEYPGLPVPLPEGGRSYNPKDSTASISDDVPPEDAGSLFIQCDTCHVWQHGGCVGIMEQAMTPENYYCEECRKDLHKIFLGAKGQKYSRYLPVYEPLLSKPARKSSSGKDAEPRPKEAELRAAQLSSAKKRSTMNSRAALDEEEALRKAIEESKSDGSGAISGNGSRRAKRAREELEELRQDLKRRKTGSETESLSNEASPTAGSDDEQNGKSRGVNGLKKTRGLNMPVPKERESRDREKEKQRERHEATSRRKGRTEYRRADESEAPEDPLRAVPKVSNGRSRAQQSKTPINGQTTSSQRKGAKPVRRGRVGRNQYTKERDLAADKNESPRASHSRDSEDAGNGGSDGQAANVTGNGSKPSKPRHMNPNRTSMNDLRKRAAGILEYISQTQVEIAGERTPPNSEPKSGQLPRALSSNGASKLSNEVEVNGSTGREDKDEHKVDEMSFKELNSLQMMDILTRELVLWQRDHGKFGEKQ